MILGEAPAGCDKPAPRALYALLATGLLFGSLWGGSEAARAATCIGEACEYGSRCMDDIKASRELAEVEVHPVSNAVEPAAAPALDGSATEAMAPLLYLTPRVATILDQVFGDGGKSERLTAAERSADDAGPVPAATVDEQTAAALPAVAGTEAGPSATGLFEPLAVPDNGVQLPKFQRQMYRTDI